MLLNMLLIAALAWAMSACDGLKKSITPEPARLYVVLVDVSGSTPMEDAQLYEETYLKAVSSLVPGDRLVLARITEASLTRFSSLADLSLKTSGVSFDDEEAAKKAQKELTEAYDKVRDVHATHTKIIDALEAAAGLASDDKTRQPSILVLSDMLEESEQFNFEKTPITDVVTRKYIDRRQSQHRLPAMSGAKVYVVGASAKDQERYHLVHDFWSTYLDATGATLVTYGRTVPVFRQ